MSKPEHAPIPATQKTNREFMGLAEGDKYEGIGRIVQELILKTPDLIVFIDECGGVQWAHNALHIRPIDYNAITNRIAELEVRSRFLHSNKPLRPGQDIAMHEHSLFAARRLIAEAMARLLDPGSVSAAHGALDIAEKWIQQRSRASSRMWMLFPFFVLAGLGTVFFLYLALSAKHYFEAEQRLIWLAGGLLGGLGALVANVMFNRKIPFDATAGAPLHLLEAILRWSVGFVAGLAAQMLIQGDVLLGFVGTSNHPPEVGLALSLFAGSSDLFFPTLLHRFDNSLKSSGKQMPSTDSQASPPGNHSDEASS
jgi:hypothetical protein